MLVGNLTKKFMSKGFIWGETFYCLPYTWNPINDRPSLSKSRKRIFGWIFSFLATIATSLILIYRFQSILNSGTKTKKYSEKFLLVFIIILCLMSIIMQIFTFLSYKDIPIFFKQIQKFTYKFKGNGSNKQAILINN